MPERYRGAGGFFLSPEQARAAGTYFREMWEGGRRVSSERVEQTPSPPRPPTAGAPSREAPLIGQPRATPLSGRNWDDRDAGDFRHPILVREAINEDGSYAILDDSAFATRNIPPGVQSYQLRYIVENDPRYPLEWASDIVTDIREWNGISNKLDDARLAFGEANVGAIVFRF